MLIFFIHLNVDLLLLKNLVKNNEISGKIRYTSQWFWFKID